MRYSDFQKLDHKQQLTLLIAMHIRNELEGFHIANLSNTQMKELNRTVRQAIFDILSLSDSGGEEGEQAINWLVRRTPDYWEVPARPSGSLHTSGD